ncbi:CaiB/BaiF CoA-transferase family protein [Phenylobacterium sp.]|jgi:formyl-CoA transferase|uniref:CaiB/BaiF CoA transferase family protein n=1 Tax=Phenylobacterium sp. TaxID=1871053 RepID=UPI002F3FAECF
MDRPPPLARFKVLDLTRARAGPTAVRQFADWGADVLMIEGGEPMELTGFRDGSDFQNLHRGKRSLSLDLKSAEGQAIFYRLVETADVLFENYRPSVKHRLGVDYETLRAINPRLVYVSISGFGQEGPYRDRPGVDQIAQGMAGLMSVTGLPGQGPVRAGIAVADSSAGIYGALGAMMALLEREATGEGRWVQTSLLQSLIAMSDFQAARWLTDGVAPGQAGNDHPTVTPMGLFPAADGMINVAAAGAVMFGRFCKAADAERLLADPRFSTSAGRTEHRRALAAEIAAITSTRPCGHWVEALNAAGVPCGPVNSMDQVFADPQVRQLGIARTVQHPRLGPLTLVGQPIDVAGSEPTLAAAAPDHGAHTDEVLAGLGFDAAAVAGLRERGVV